MLENQMESDKMIEISEADFSELPEIAALEREIFPDAWSLKSLEETWKQKNAAIFVAKTKEGMAGYLIFYYVLEEGGNCKDCNGTFCAQTRGSQSDVPETA